jgi:hypothetical protein
MILINLLPPELRKRGAEFQFNPIMAGGVGGLALCVVVLFGFLWLRGELATANDILADKNTELEAKTAQAKVVTERQALIADFEKRRDTLFGLLGRKMYWARTIDEFSKQITGEWSQPGFKVSAGDLTISYIPTEKRAGGADEVRASFRWRYKIVGEENQKSGDYINSFFKTIEKGPFWASQGFISKPDDRYDGDRPRWNPGIKRVIVEGGVDWQRVKLSEFMKKGVKTPRGK